MKYRKKPIIIEAYQTDIEQDIETLEGTMHANIGDYIITGVNGEKYPCKPDIFEKTYEKVSNDILFKVNEAIKNYYNKHERQPNAILINENDLFWLKYNSLPSFKTDITSKEKAIYEVYGLKIIPIKYGEIQAVEELLWNQF